jgi:aldehyde:ferredoxin oxidoreductase
MSKHKITPKACFACPIACSYDLEITSGPYKGYVATCAGGGENLEGAASIVGVYESGEVYYLIDLCDRLGFDSSTIGCTIALAIEAYEKGLLTKEDTEGIVLKWGDVKLVEKLLNMAARKEGKLGKLLALGPKKAAEWIGGDAPKFAVHIKGAGMNLHDWRATMGIMLGQFVGGGSGWPAPAADAWASEPDVGFPQYQDPINPRIKPEAVAKTWPKKYWDDCNGTCWFATWGVPGVLTFSAEAVSAVTGWDFTPQEALTVGERVVNLERVFNVRRGLTPADDYEVSPRMVEAPPSGKAKGIAMAPYVKGMVMEVYRLMGWDEKTGKPWISTLERLGLHDVIKDIWG